MLNRQMDEDRTESQADKRMIEHALRKMKEIEKKGSVYELDCMNRLLEKLSFPHRSLQAIHVAGTNGKGSVIAFLREILVRAGYRTGSYVSPAVFSKMECFTINRKPMEETAYIALLSEVLEAAGQIKREGIREPSAFEIETALAFLYFQRQGCELVLLETGLGGDLDATNVVERPLVSVFTSISKDHEQLLGNTLTEIAMHKSGIIKFDCPVVSSAQTDEVRQALEQRAAIMNTTISYARAAQIIDSDFYPRFCYNDNHYEVHLLGAHQIENACTALAVVERLRKAGLSIDEQAVREGLRQARWPGRFSCLHRNPDIYMDGAHNEGAAKALSGALQQYMGKKRIIMIAGMLKDKAYERVVSIVGRYADCLITITPPLERGLPAKTLKEAAGRHNIKAVAADTVSQAVSLALEQMKETDALLAFGSLSFLREFEQCIYRLCPSGLEKEYAAH